LRLARHRPDFCRVGNPCADFHIPSPVVDDGNGKPANGGLSSG
jgi:hypothetical protein